MHLGSLMQRRSLIPAIHLFRFMSTARWAVFMLLFLQCLFNSVAVAESLGGQTIPHNLSPWGMFVQADWVVKAVMLGLLLASVITWTVWLVKSAELRRARKQSAEPLRQLTNA